MSIEKEYKICLKGTGSVFYQVIDILEEGVLSGDALTIFDLLKSNGYSLTKDDLGNLWDADANHISLLCFLLVEDIMNFEGVDLVCGSHFITGAEIENDCLIIYYSGTTKCEEFFKFLVDNSDWVVFEYEFLKD